MRRLVAQISDIRPGESVLVLKTTLTLFFVVAGHTLSETARDALFLRQLPASRLPLVYAVLALAAVLASKWAAKLVFFFGRRTGLLLTLLCAAYGNVVFYMLPASQQAVFGLYVFSGLVSSVAVAQFWTLANDWYTVAQGRRLFGLVSGGGVLGAVTGASGALIALNYFDVEGLLLGASGAYILAAGVVTLVGTQDDSLRPLRTRNETPPAMELAVEACRSHPYVLRLAALLALSTAALLVTDYLFKSAAARHFAPQELGGFFAWYYAALNTLALVIQFAASGYVVKRFGVLMAFLILPMLLFSGGAAILVFGAPLVVVLSTKAADGGLRHSLHRVTTELLWMPLPDQIRVATKPFVDTVVARGAQALTAAGLMLLAASQKDEPVRLALVLCLLLVGWLALGARLRRPYLSLFREALGGRRADIDYKLDLDTAEYVVEALSSREPSKVIAAMELLATNGRARLIPALILFHESAEVLIAALSTIATPEREDWIPLAKRLLEHESVDVRVAAMKALVGVGIYDAVEERLYDVRPEVRGHAAFFVVQGAGVEDALQHETVKDLLSLTGAAGKGAKLGLLASIESAGAAESLADDATKQRPGRRELAQRFGSLLLDLAEDPDEEVAEAAAFAMARVPDARFIPTLIWRLGLRRGREAVQEALTYHGEGALQQLASLLAQESTPARLRRHIPATIAMFGTQQAADILCSRLDQERVGLVRYKILKALGVLVARYRVRVNAQIIEAQLEKALIEHVRMSVLALGLQRPSEHALPESSLTEQLLLQLLDDKAKQALGRAFRLLQLLNPNEDIGDIQTAMGSGDKRVRAQALEYVDTLTLDLEDSRIRELFGIIVDDLPLEEGLERLGEQVVALPQDSSEALSQLLQNDDGMLATIAAYHVLERGPGHEEQKLVDAVLAVAKRPSVALLDRELIAMFTDSLRPVHVT